MVRNLYHYEPSQALAIVALVLFAITTIGIGYQSTRHRAWYFIPFFIGGLCEVAGYIARLAGRTQTDVLGPYVAQSLLLLIPPILFSATIYMTLKRNILYVNGSEHSVVRVSMLTKLFVWADVISLFVQASGAGLQAVQGENSNLPTIGKWIVIVGLAIQLVAFSFFLYVAAVFHQRAVKDPKIEHGTIKTLLVTLYLSGILIMVRSVYRVAEFAMGYEGYLMSNETLFYIFDSLLMFLVTVIYNVIFPSRVMVRKPTMTEEKNAIYLVSPYESV